MREEPQRGDMLWHHAFPLEEFPEAVIRPCNVLLPQLQHIHATKKSKHILLPCYLRKPCFAYTETLSLVEES